MAKFEREVEIDSEQENTWKVLINPAYWPEWFPGVDNVSSAHSTGLMTVGKTISLIIGGEAGTATFVRMDQPDKLEITTQVGKDKDQHVFKLKATGGLLGMAKDETKVEYTLDTLSGGGLIGKFFSTGNPVDSARVSKAMIKFRKLVEKTR